MPDYSEDTTAQSSISVARHEKYWSWNIHVVFKDEDEAAVMDRIRLINKRLTREYAPDLASQLERSITALEPRP
jgi:hypothetical protein